MAEKSANYGPDLMRMAEKSLLLQLLDQTWKDHLLTLDHLRQGINLRAYGQRDPLNEYKREAFELFEAMLANLRQHVTSVLSYVELRVQPQPVFASAGAEPEEAMAEEAGATGTTGRPFGPPSRTPRRPGSGNGADRTAPRLAGPRPPWAGTPRNAPCPCGSGKKFKHCHGRV
jgi:preprotein translocase subunit SecA